MVTRRFLRDPLPLLAVLIGVLLAGLALLQHRWLAAVSAAERTRMRSSAAGRAEAFARDVDRELTRAFLMLGVDGAAVERGDHETYARALAAWKARAAYPDLIADVWLVQASPAGGGMPRVRRFDPGARRFVESVEPAEMAPLVARLGAGRKPDGAGPVTSLGSMDATIPAILVPSPQRPPLTEPPAPSERVDHVFVFRNDLEPLTWSVIRIDRQALEQHILPDLARKHAAGDDGLEYHVTISAPGTSTAGAASSGAAIPPLPRRKRARTRPRPRSASASTTSTPRSSRTSRPRARAPPGRRRSPPTARYGRCSRSASPGPRERTCARPGRSRSSIARARWTRRWPRPSGAARRWRAGCSSSSGAARPS